MNRRKMKQWKQLIAAMLAITLLATSADLQLLAAPAEETATRRVELMMKLWKNHKLLDQRRPLPCLEMIRRYFPKWRRNVKNPARPFS